MRLNWPSPLLDPALTVDPFVDVRDDGGGRVVVLTESGQALHAELTSPLPGVVRVRIAADLDAPRPSPMLRDGIAATPARLGAEVTWTAGDGLRIGAFRSTTATGRSGRTNAGWLLTHHLVPDAAVFGGGESYQGPDLRGRVRRLINVETNGAIGFDASYLNVPLFWSDAGWGVFVHTGAPVRADLGATHAETAAIATEGDELDVFIFTGDGPTILAAYHELTGLPGALPDWAYGVWSSRCSYLSEAELHGIVDGYEAAGCPVDVVHVDAWVTGNVVADLACNWEIDRGRFPEGWAKRLAERGVRTSLWHNPYVMAGSPLAATLERDGLLVRDATGALAVTADKTDRNVVDLTNPAAVAWWQNQVRTTATNEGVAAFKPDFAEELPEDAVLHDGRRGRAARNEYALVYQRATFDALTEVVGADEVALFCRSGTAGAQRHPCHWVGDTPSTWDGLTAALRACLSLSLSGFGAVSHDVGGFYVDTSFAPLREAFERMDPSPITADVDPLLFLRWTQWGALSPVMRFHGTGRREPFAYAEPFGSLAVDACRLRTRLRSYLVATGKAAATTGAPMMRPMPLAYPGDRAARDADLQYLLGADVLVAPLCDPSGSRRVWIPPGDWLPLWGLTPVTGPDWATVDCTPSAFPAWVRAGANVLEDTHA